MLELRLALFKACRRRTKESTCNIRTAGRTRSWWLYDDRTMHAMSCHRWRLQLRAVLQLSFHA